MDHVGIDVHKKESQICILAEGGELVEQRIWATLMKRVFALDVLLWPRAGACGGR